MASNTTSNNNIMSSNNSNPTASDDEKSHTFRKRRLSLSSRNKTGADCPSDASASHANASSTRPSTSNEPPLPLVETISTPGKQQETQEADQKAHTFRKRRLSLTSKAQTEEDHDGDKDVVVETLPPAVATNKRPRRASDASGASFSSAGIGDGQGLKVRTLHAGEIITTNNQCPPSPVPHHANDTNNDNSNSSNNNDPLGGSTHVLYRQSRPSSLSLLEQQAAATPQGQPKWKKRIVRKHDEDERKLPFPRDIVGTYSCHGVEPVYDSDFDPMDDDLDDDEDTWTEDITGSNNAKPSGTTFHPFPAIEPKPTTAAKINQDRGGVAFPYGNCPRTALFAAYDGHGQGGELVSQFALHEIQSRLEKQPEFPDNLEKAFKDTFLQVDEALDEEPLIDPLYAGTTACVSLLRETTLTTANAGDSRAVVARRISKPDDKATRYQAIDLTVDQNPDLPEEKERIERMGGFVSPPPEPGLSARVWLDEGFSQIGLAMARSIGDHAVSRVGVIAEPVVTQHQVLPEDEFMIIATDGVWEFLSSEQAVEIVGANLARGATKATQALIEAAASRWHDEEGDYRDDITALVVRLQELWKDGDGTGTDNKDAAAVASSSSEKKAEPEKLEFPDVVKLLSLRKPPVQVRDLSLITKLDLPGCNLSQLPESLPEALPNLSILFLSNNQFEEVPEVIGKCKKLQMVAFKANKLSSIHPEALQSQMRWLILTDNKIMSIPSTIGRCKKLQKCMLSGNLLTELPDEISECQNLELIRLSSNRLEKAPLKLLDLPSLNWVALSGNPFIQNAIPPDEQKLLVISDISEEEGEILGKGAGGITRKATWRNRVVAVKTFVGTMTSDGSPEEERRVSSTVGSKITSPYLIAALGETPNGSLVMEYLDNFTALAGPPSLETCSRDVYTRMSSFMTEDNAIAMISGLLELLGKLHQQGIIHGDFYSHNILVSEDDSSVVKLSDFGAAFFYDTKAEYAKKLERTELRAFAVFAEEVTNLFVQERKAKLQGLVNSCREDDASFEKVNKAWKDAMKL